MRRYLILLVLAVSCFAQTKAPVKSRALRQCEVSLQTAAEDVKFRDDVVNGLTEDNGRLGKLNEELTAKNAELTKQMEELRAVGRDVLAYVQQRDAEYKALTIVYDAMVKELNRSTDALNERNTRAVERMAAAQEQNARINRAMSMFNMWQQLKTPPPQLQMPLPAPPVRVNCTSRTIGTTVYTDCN
jgi:septal ring factor EnvC (AmiA/AmiB activator)